MKWSITPILAPVEVTGALQAPSQSATTLAAVRTDVQLQQINDSVGHGVGDAVLVEVGARPTRILRPEDTAARLGGDSSRC